jgi:hypothetical protein
MKMTSPLFALLGCILSFNAAAYSGKELLEDCQAAEAFYTEKKSTDPYQSVRGARCMAYVAGFADGYGIGDFLAEKVGTNLNAICLPEDGNLSYRLVRAVLAHLERQPPNNAASTATLVAGALSKAFPCTANADVKK